MTTEEILLLKLPINTNINKSINQDRVVLPSEEIALLNITPIAKQITSEEENALEQARNLIGVKVLKLSRKERKLYGLSKSQAKQLVAKQTEQNAREQANINLGHKVFDEYIPNINLNESSALRKATFNNKIGNLFRKKKKYSLVGDSKGHWEKDNTGKLSYNEAFERNRSGFEPIEFYINDLKKGIKSKLGFDASSKTRTEKDNSNLWNKLALELAALSIIMNKHGVTNNKGELIKDIEPAVYRQYNYQNGEPAKYADFSNPLLFFNPKHRVEYSDGGMTMASKIKNNDGSYSVVLTDEAAWDPDKGASYSSISPRGLPITLGITKKNLKDKVDKMRYEYQIPAEMIDSMENVYLNKRLR